MNQRRHHRDPVIWLIFAIAVSVPSIELARLLRERDAARAAASNVAPHVAPAGQPRSSASTSAQAPVVPTPTPVPPTAPRSAPQEAVYIGPVDTQRVVVVDTVRGASARDADSSRFVPIPPTATPIVTSTVLPDGEIAAVLEESGVITVWDLKLHKLIRSFDSGLPLHTESMATWPQMMLVRPRELALEQALLALGGSDGQLRVWNALTGQKVFTVPHPTGSRPLIDVAWTGLLDVATVGGDGTIGVWHVTLPVDSALLSMPRGPGGAATEIDFSLATGALAVGSHGGLHVTRKLDRAWASVDTGLGKHPQKVMFSGNGRYVASAWSNGEIRVYGLPIIRAKKEDGTYDSGTIKPHMIVSFVIAKPPHPLLAFSHNGTWLAVSGYGPWIHLWWNQPGPGPGRLTLPRGSTVRSMWFSPDARSLVVSIQGERYLRSLPLPGMR